MLAQQTERSPATECDAPGTSDIARLNATEHDLANREDRMRVRRTADAERTRLTERPSWTECEWTRGRVTTTESDADEPTVTRGDNHANQDHEAT